ncbi:MAG TPA: hypothetical protein VJT73_08940 [Polyangiaceae bacterium]|nr:hypothetical protein [Polyangiaceae bacterium]
MKTIMTWTLATTAIGMLAAACTVTTTDPADGGTTTTSSTSSGTAGSGGSNSDSGGTGGSGGTTSSEGGGAKPTGACGVCGFTAGKCGPKAEACHAIATCAAADDVFYKCLEDGTEITACTIPFLQDARVDNDAEKDPGSDAANDLAECMMDACASCGTKDGGKAD